MAAGQAHSFQAGARLELFVLMLCSFGGEFSVAKSRNAMQLGIINAKKPQRIMCGVVCKGPGLD